MRLADAYTYIYFPISLLIYYSPMKTKEGKTQNFTNCVCGYERVEGDCLYTHKRSLDAVCESRNFLKILINSCVLNKNDFTQIDCESHESNYHRKVCSCAMLTCKRSQFRIRSLHQIQQKYTIINLKTSGKNLWVQQFDLLNCYTRREGNGFGLNLSLMKFYSNPITNWRKL